MTTSSNKEGYPKYQYQYQYQYQPYDYGWNTTSPDYHAHVSSSEKLSSVVTDIPRYPYGRDIFNIKVTSYGDESPRRMNQGHDYSEGVAPRRMNQAPQAHKKVHFVEQEKTTQVVKADDNNKKWENVYGESIDAKADGFINQKHKKFELAKWETFKEY